VSDVIYFDGFSLFRYVGEAEIEQERIESSRVLIYISRVWIYILIVTLSCTVIHDSIGRESMTQIIALSYKI